MFFSVFVFMLNEEKFGQSLMNVFIFISKMGLDKCSRIDLNDYLMFQIGLSVELLEIRIETRSHSHRDEILWKWLAIGVHYLHIYTMYSSRHDGSVLYPTD